MATLSLSQSLLAKADTERKMKFATKGSRRRNRDKDTDDRDKVVKAFHDILFSWSLEDIFNEELYSDRIAKIPDTFDSVEDYKKTFVYPLLEETREDLCSSLDTISSAPYAKLTEFSLLKVELDWWRKGVTDPRKEPYKTMCGDVLLLVDVRPQKVEDLQKFGRAWTLAIVTEVIEDGKDPTLIQFKVATPEKMENEKRSDFEFAIYLVGTTPSERIWLALHMYRSPDIIRKVLDIDSLNEEECKICSKEVGGLDASLSDDLNDSQKRAISLCLRKVQCEHTSAVELIWGPPGTGKTKTTSVMLLSLLGTNCSTVVCAPTNIAVMELASRVLQLLRSSSSVEYGRHSKICQLGDILLFGNKARLKIDRNNEEIYFDYRVKKIRECLAPFSGWRNCIFQMDCLLNGACEMYRCFLENECNEGSRDSCSKPKSFLEFLRDRFSSTRMQLERCMSTLCTHISKRLIQERHFHEIILALSELKLFGNLLHGQDLLSLRLEEAFSSSKVESPHSTLKGPLLTLYLKRLECLSALTSLMDYLSGLTFPNYKNKFAVARFCYESASMLFSTASTTHRLHSMRKAAPLDVLVIDEAAQLRECESVIPLHLRGLRHAILIGDEKQLPSVVMSEVAKEAGFGRSMFERLSSLGAPKHLLNIQYRMHPSISLFPNHAFYSGQIHDAPNVMSQSYRKSYLPSPFFGQCSFINITDGTEERSGNGKKSLRNSVEVAVVLGILNKLWKAWSSKRPKENLSVGVISPYLAQVGAIHDKLGHRYDHDGGFKVKVMTVDGFQGGEQDIIIISTVRSNSDGSIGFLSSPQRMNVALTRARYCLWILGSAETLTRKPSEWAALVHDVKDRGCFFNAEEDKDVARSIIDAKKESDCLHDLLYDRSLLFKDGPWKVIFRESFIDSFRKAPQQTKSSVVDLLKRLSSGWRPKKKNLDIVCAKSSQIVKKFNVEGFHVIWTVDIEKEPTYVQVLKFWYIIPGSLIEEKVKDLDAIYKKYSNNFINHCKEKCLERGLEIPKIWENPSDFMINANASRNQNKEDTEDFNDEEELVEALQSLELQQTAKFIVSLANTFAMEKERLQDGSGDVPRMTLNTMLEDLKHLDAALDIKELKLDEISKMKEIIERLQSRRMLN